MYALLHIYLSVSFYLYHKYFIYPTIYWRTNPINLPEKCVVDYRVNHNAGRSCGGRCDALNSHGDLAKGIYYINMLHAITHVFHYGYIHIYTRGSFVQLVILYTHRCVCTRILWAYYFPHRLFDGRSDSFYPGFLKTWRIFICFLKNIWRKKIYCYLKYNK